MPAQSGSLQQAEPALDRQREGDELASLSTGGRSVTVIAVLVVFYTLYFAASLLVPIAAAVLLSMLLAPAAQFLERLHMPRLADSFFGRRYGHRAVILETVAAVPGMVGGALTHLKSLRRFEDDRGWIKTLLDEAQNERAHLMTFSHLAKPTSFERFLVIAAQGVFFNLFFLYVSVLATRRTPLRRLSRGGGDR